MYDISLSIVTFNNEQIIERTLKSLVSHIDQRISNIIYIIDNKSSDATVKIVSGQEGNIKIIENEENVGFGSGHNQILELLSSKYHVCVNPDITIENNVIYEMYEYMEKHPEIGLLTPLVKFPDGRIQYLCKRTPTLWDLFIRLVLPRCFKNRQDYFMMKHTGYKTEFEVEYATGCFMFFRTSVFKELGGFDPNFFLHFEDADITRRVNQVSKTVFFPYNYVLHDWQRGSHHNYRIMWITIKSAMYYFKKWGLKII